MAHYAGSGLLVKFNTVDISGHARSVDVSEDAGDPDIIDVSHKGDTAHVIIEGMAGADQATVTLKVLQDTTPTAAETHFDVGDKDTLYVYPSGQTHGYAALIIQNARLTSMSDTIPYDGAVELTLTWKAANSVTRTTYSSA